jgi:spore maturation protein CgeB
MPTKWPNRAVDGADVAGLVMTMDPQRARAIARAAFRRVLASHTYAHRAAQLESVLEMRNTIQREIVL